MMGVAMGMNFASMRNNADNTNGGVMYKVGISLSFHQPPPHSSSSGSHAVCRLSVACASSFPSACLSPTAAARSTICASRVCSRCGQTPHPCPSRAGDRADESRRSASP
jgi:hypothetical protein